MNNRLTKATMLNPRRILITLALALASNCVWVKPISNEKEQAKAERAAGVFHQLHNEGRFEELYGLFDEEARRVVKKDEVAAAAKQTFEKWGKVQSVSLSQAKVFPVSVIQVKMIYNVKFEKGEAQELFSWAIRGDEARLLRYQIWPGFDNPDSKK